MKRLLPITLFALVASATLAETPSALDPQPPVVLVGLKAKTNPPASGTPQYGLGQSPKSAGDAPAPSTAPAKNARALLAGTKWMAVPEQPLRGGLADTLSFQDKIVTPGGYRYEVNQHDSSVTIFFHHGDTQLMLLMDEGRRLKFVFGSHDYTYKLIPE